MDVNWDIGVLDIFGKTHFSQGIIEGESLQSSEFYNPH